MVVSVAVVIPLAQYFLFRPIEPVIDNVHHEPTVSNPSPPSDLPVTPPSRPPRKMRIVTPSQGAGTTPPFSGVTEFDEFSNQKFREALSKRMKELRSFEQSYDKRKRSAISSGSSFEEISKQKEAIELEEEQEFKKYVPELRSMYNSLLKRQKSHI
jgi:vacuolar-type H+-ATPase subunit H